MKYSQNLFLAVSVLVSLSVTLSAQTGGQFAITQSVTAGGGASSAGGNFAVTGTNAQPNAGDNSGGGQFAVESGFWQPFFAPTAAAVSVSGRVTTGGGGGIANVRVVMTDQSGVSRTAVSNSFGNFRFSQVAAGEIYVFTVHSRRYQFGVPSQILWVADHVSDLLFIADLK